MAKAPVKRKYPTKDKGPSKTDLLAESIEQDILDFWKAIATSNLSKWTKPWVYQITQAENAGKFLTSGERYVYRGGFNQFLIACAAQDIESGKASLILNRTDMSAIFGVKEFGESPVVKNGVKSLTSIYNAPVEKKVASCYVYPSGARWSGESEKPSKAEIESLQLTEKSIKKLVYNTFPVWSVHDIYDHLPQEHKEKIDDLIAIREAKAYEFNPNDDFDQHVLRTVDDMISRQGIKVKNGNEKAFYEVIYDEMTMPLKHQFKNPIQFLATTCHEAAHSTLHLLGRNHNFSDSMQVLRSIEEVIAETTAVMMVKDFEKTLKDVMPVRPDIQKMFDDYYQNSMNYNHMWGEKFDLLHNVKCIEIAKKENKGIIKSTLVQIAKAVDTLKNGSYTPEQRLDAKLKNLNKSQDRRKAPEYNM
jgi:hypothetical protein